MWQFLSKSKKRRNGNSYTRVKKESIQKVIWEFLSQNIKEGKKKDALSTLT